MRDDGIPEEVERGALAPAVGEPAGSNLARTERGAQVGRKGSRPRRLGLSGTDRRRMGDAARVRRGGASIRLDRELVCESRSYLRRVTSDSEPWWFKQLEFYTPRRFC